MARTLRGLVLLALALGTAACAATPRAHETVCRALAAALVPDASARIVSVAPPDAERVEIVLHPLEPRGGRERRLVCAFHPQAPGDSGPRLAGVALDGASALSPAALFLLETLWLPRALAGLTAPPFHPAAYLAQQILNAAAPAGIYALLGLGYALIYGIIGRINLAFGEFAVAGAYAALAGVATALTLDLPWWAGPPAALVLALAVGTALGRAAAGLVFVPLQRRPSLAPLVATIGLGICLGEGLRLAQGARGGLLPPQFGPPLVLWREGAGAVALGWAQILTLGLALVVALGLTVGLRRTGLGRAYRACADDLGMAALVGVAVTRTVTATCAAGGALAGLAGSIIVLHYGVVNVAMGALIGFKGLAGAVVGGIGSLPGAMLGGALLGLLETFWAAYLPGTYREIGLFALLNLMLVLRPNGLLGQPLPRDELGSWRRSD